MAINMNVTKIKAFGDSMLVENKVNDIYEAKKGVYQEVFVIGERINGDVPGKDKRQRCICLKKICVGGIPPPVKEGPCGCITVKEH